MPRGFRQRLTIPQFAALIQFNWNDPAELAEIQKALPTDAATDDLRESVAARLAKLKAEEGEKVALASRSHRRLNLKQLVTLSEVYWDDPAKLAEILEALRARLEPEADALFRSVARRIDLLKNDPKAAAAERPPGEAERAAGAPDAPTEPIETTASGGARRRVPVFVLAGVVAAAAAAWFLWPRDKDREADTLAEPGAEILAQGERPEDQPKPPGLAAPPLASVPPRPAPTDRAPLSPVGGAKARADSETEMGGGRAGGGRGAATPNEPNIHEPPSAGAAGRSADNKPREPAAPRAASAASRSAPPNATRAPAQMPVGAEAGIAIAEARLSCYRTSPDPENCSEPAAPGPREPPAAAARVAAAAGGGAGGAPPPKSGASTDPLDAARSAAPSASARHDPTPPARGGGGGPSGGGAGGGAASGGGAAPDTGAGVLASARGKSSRVPGGGGGAAAEVGQKIQRPPMSREAMPQTPSASDCPSEPAAGRVVFILDGSVSMGLPLDVDAALEDELDEGIRRHDPDARREYRALLAEPGPKRITRAREAFTAAVSELPDGVDLGLVVFQECRDIRKVGVFEAARRGAAIDYIKALVPKGRTPLADSLRSAAEMLGEEKSSIVLLTDGREFCSGDPCAAAAEIRAQHPGTPIHIIDITGQAKAECVADLTGGRSYKPEAADDLAQVVRNAFRGADAQCVASGESAAADAPPR